ncbi:disks large-associated protein 5 isoform X1 [Pangasianodon hypophthalmus]|uniref:disks large-associated protein 5 isoform X1 n=1 Tax=Pangasianodon hypophthalmus TaxID=310915 RepID=UPI0023081213|nr:disks large-associated protein 5 isoform X1 [Pangasianodon hypophthalmus]
MDSRFAHLYKRDSSVSMIRVKMSRRRSQTQKENREKMQNLRRNLDKLPELEVSLDVSTLEKSVLPSQETGRKAKADNSAAEERKKMLARFKENKALQKEKERREKEKKGTFKVGLYRPQPLGYLPLNPVVPSTKMTTESVQSTRVTRSMKQHLQPKQPAEKQTAPKKAEPPSTRANKSSVPATVRGRTAAVEPVVRAPTTRSAAKAVTAALTTKSVAKPAADLRPPKTKSANRQPAAPSSGRGKNMQGHIESVADEKKETKVADVVVAAVNPSPPKEEKMVEEANVTPVSFAPQGFVFQPPSGLRTFQPTPLSPRSADAFLSPSFSVEPRMESASPISPPSDSSSAPPLSSPPPCMSEPCPASASKSAPKSAPSPLPPASSASPSLPPASVPLPPPPLPPACPSPSSAPSEPQHDVPYFRAVMASETERLTGLSEFWELRFDDSSIPEEMRDRMRTAVGQARLLMKERFGQFSGLVDDCEFGRGEKITTCTDLQGFWDMVYFQVEDVDKKFNALKEAEARAWQEEIKPVTRQKKVIKKPPAAGGKTGAGVGASAAAKSRLAAVKAAMKAKQAAAAKAAEASDRAQDDSAPASDALANTLTAQTVVFHGGFFQVESPVKVVGVVRRSSRLSAALFTQGSPHGSKFSTPGRQQRATAVAHPSPLPCAPPTASPPTSPAAVARTTASPLCTPKKDADPLPCSPKPLHISPEQHRSAPCVSPNGVSHTHLSQPDHNTSLNNTQSDLMLTPVDDQMNQSAEIKPHSSPCQLEEELPHHLPAHSGSSTEPEGSAQESAMTALSQEQTEETVFDEVDMFHSDSQAHAMSFTHSPSACKTTPRAETAENCVSIPSSPCMMSTTPQQVQVISPAPSDETDTCVDERSPISADCKATENQDSESITGLDFERYLQPTARCSLSPVNSMAVDRFSLGLEDAEMESPQAQAEEPVQDALMTPTAFPRMAPLVVTPWTEEMIANPLLFTPEQKERVRQSVCERDLMMFTPPANI